MPKDAWGVIERPLYLMTAMTGMRQGELLAIRWRDLDDHLVFGHPETGRPLDRSTLRKRFKAALIRAGVRDVRSHDLRHTFGARLAASGVALRTLQAWYGHRDSATTDRYVHYQPGEREADMITLAFGLVGDGGQLGGKLSETEAH